MDRRSFTQTARMHDGDKEETSIIFFVFCYWSFILLLLTP